MKPHKTITTVAAAGGSAIPDGAPLALLGHGPARPSRWTKDRCKLNIWLTIQRTFQSWHDSILRNGATYAPENPWTAARQDLAVAVVATQIRAQLLR